MDLTDPSWWQTNAKAEWAVVMGAPVAFLFALAIILVPMFLWIRAHYRERIEALRATIEHKQSQLDEYKDRLHGTPLEVAKEIIDLQTAVERLKGRVERPQRRLSDEQAAAMREVLVAAQDEDKLTAVFIGYAPETESSRYSSQLAQFFHDQKIHVQKGLGQHDEGEVGLVLYLPYGVTEPVGRAKTLATALQSAGIAFALGQQAERLGMPFGFNFYLQVSPESED